MGLLIGSRCFHNLLRRGSRQVFTGRPPYQSRPVSEWRKNSKNKLCRGDSRCFQESGRNGDSDELLCAVGAWVSAQQPDVLPRKELFEAHAVAEIVHKYFPFPGRILDLCAGSGLLAAFLAIQEPGRELVCVDLQKTPLATRLLDSLSEHWPALLQQIGWKESDIRRLDTLPSIGPRDLIVSVHACGLLSDDVMVAATSEGALRPLVLVPCCHSLRPRIPNRPQPWMPNRSWDSWPWLQAGAVNLKGAAAIDVARADYLRHRGYRVIIEEIDAYITPMNRVIVALPE
eukprot:gnl/TRDRNA2_/TRDRNA2_72799_c0_seq2.p1 gnl/TRDRNA2_/TRDRNA2_72799_c0~~gnl/TRDRNA2_/TRDRNA2_72799_c0_seq2.p1  ORF type:complete len:287 (+),score=32.80 gnl/TRDRNA2_/TRDRNA2_72799_c0_seq2:98-958(+)